MVDEIISIMAKNMGVNHFESEKASHFCNRVLYSAMSCWVKTCALDRPITNIEPNNNGVSRKHITNKCMKILEKLLLCVPTAQAWFSIDENTNSAIKLIIDRLLRHGDLLRAGFDTNLALASFKTILLSPEINCIKGYLLESNSNLFYSGISVLETNKILNSESTPISIDSVAWIDEYLKAAWWESISSLDNSLEYFDAYQKSKPNYKNWTHTQPKTIDGYLFARRRINNHDEYLFIKNNGSLSIHRVDRFFSEINESPRFMFALRKKANNLPPANISVYSDHVRLKVSVYLPEKENRLLESFAWPHNRIMDKLEWDMLLPVWRYIKPYLESLGLTIWEEFKNG